MKVLGFLFGRCRWACMAGVVRLTLRTEGGTPVGSRSGDKVGEDVMVKGRWRRPWQLGGVVGSSPPHVLFGGLIVLQIWSAGQKEQV